MRCFHAFLTDDILQNVDSKKGQKPSHPEDFRYGVSSSSLFTVFFFFFFPQETTLWILEYFTLKNSLY